MISQKIWHTFITCAIQILILAIYVKSDIKAIEKTSHTAQCDIENEDFIMCT